MTPGGNAVSKLFKAILATMLLAQPAVAQNFPSQAPFKTSAIRVDSLSNQAGSGAPNFPFGATGITAAVADLNISAVSTPNATISAGYLRTNDGREYGTYDGSGTTSGDYTTPLTINLTTVLGSSPANATTYYLYVNAAIPAAQTLTDNGRKVYSIIQSAFYLSTSPADSVDSSLYIPIGFIKTATTGNAWSGTGSAFGSVATKTSVTGVAAASPVVYQQAKLVVGSVGTTTQIAAGHILQTTEWPFTFADNIAFFNLNNASDNSAATSCSSGAAACDLTNLVSVTTATGILGTAATSIDFLANQRLQSTDAFFDPGDTDFSYGGWFQADDWTPAGAMSLISQGDATTNQTWFLGVATTGGIECRGSTTGSDWTNTSVIAGFTDNTWHHLACVYTAANNTFTTYIDGKAVSTSVLPTNLRLASPNDFQIGARAGGSFFDGRIDEVFYVRGPALAAEDIRKLYAYRLNHNLNVAIEDQLWSANWYRSDSAVANQMSSGWVVSKDTTNLYMDLDLPSGAFADFSLQHLGVTPSIVPIRQFSTGYLSTTPASTYTHNLGAIPKDIKILYENTGTGQFEELPSGDWCSGTSTQLLCDWTGLTVSGSNRILVVASTGAEAVAVDAASATQQGVVSTVAQTFGGVKTFAAPWIVTGASSVPAINATTNGNNANLEFNALTSGGVAQAWRIGPNQGSSASDFEIRDQTAGATYVTVAKSTGVTTFTGGVKLRSGSPGNDTLTAFTDTTLVTPTLGSSNATQPSSVSYGAQSLKYSRVGNIMFIDVRVDFTTFTCGSPCNTGGARINGLPIVSSSSGTNGTLLACNASNLTQPGGTTHFSGNIGFAATWIDLFWGRPTGTYLATNFTSDITSSGTTKSISCSGFYFL